MTDSGTSSGIQGLWHSQQMIRRYTDQPADLPPDIHDHLTNLWKEDNLLFYTIVDLDSNLRLVSHWIVIGTKQIAIIKPQNNMFSGPFIYIDRQEIKSVKQIVSLGCNKLILNSDPSAPPLTTLYYTHRQRRAFENVKTILEQKITSRPIKEISTSELYADAVTKYIKDTQASISVNKLAVVWRLLGYLKPYKMLLFIGLLGAIAMTAMSLAPAYITGKLIDQIIKPYQLGNISLPEAANAGWILLGTLAMAYILRSIFTWIRLRTMSQLGEYIAHDLRRDIYAHLQKLSLNYFSNHQTGSLISRVSADTDRIWDFIAFGVVEVSISILMLIGLGTVLILLDTQLGLIMTIPVPLFLWIISSHCQKMQPLFLKAWHKWSKMTDVLSDTIPGIKVVKAFSQEKYESKRFNKRNSTALKTFSKIHSVWTSFWPFLMLSIKMVMLTVWIIAFNRLLGIGNNGISTLTIGTFVSFVLYMTQFTHPIEVIGQLARMLNRATSSAYRIFEVLDTEPQIIDCPKPIILNPLNGSVSFEKVRFSYDGIRQVIKELCFEVKPGEMIGLVGPSGGGKSTITNLIARFYDVTGGRIMIDGVDIRQLDCNQFRKQIGIVLQDPFLFYGSVLSNIRYSMPKATLQQVIAASKAANAHDFITKLPQGYDTIIGERGHTLSGGERQRVSIARAILHNPQILILDEATSSVDTESERKIQEAIDRLISGRTVFAIAHRLSTLSKAHRLFVIEDGKISEMGSHAELLRKRKGTYRKLYNIQQDLSEEPSD